MINRTYTHSLLLFKTGVPSFNHDGSLLVVLENRSIIVLFVEC